MKNLITTSVLLAATTTARAEPLEVEVFTASPTGFLVDSTLVKGAKDAILIDAQFTLADAHRLVAEILESKKNLTTVYITHSHPDHYFGLEVIHAAFPKAKIVALPVTVAEIKKTWQGKLAQWAPMYGNQITAHPIIPSALAGTTLELEGQALEIHGGVQGDEAESSYVWIPSIKTVVAGDIVYRGVHVWTAETKPEQRKAWAKTLDTLAALKPARVIAGHKNPKLDDSVAGLDQTRQYLAAFDATIASSKTADEVEHEMKAKFSEHQLDVILHIGAGAAFAK